MGKGCRPPCEDANDLYKDNEQQEWGDGKVIIKKEKKILVRVSGSRERQDKVSCLIVTSI